jgi:hypothetical protein
VYVILLGVVLLIMAHKLEVVVHHGGGFEEFAHNGYVGA